MKCVNATTIGKLIEAHMEKDEQKFLSYANFIAESYEEAGEKRSARIIRKRIDGTYKNDSTVVLDSESEVIIPIYIEATKQSTTAKLKLEGIGGTGISVAILYDIPIELKPFPMFTKVRVHGKELEFYLGKNGTLIQRDCKPFDFWFGK